MAMPTGFRELMLQRAGYRCERCGSNRDGLTLSHKIARSRGGPWAAWNIDVLCPPCHLGFVELHPAAAEAEGWRVRGYVTRGVYVGPVEWVHKVVNS